MPENQKEIQKNWLGELNYCLQKTKENPLFRISHRKKLIKIPIRQNLKEKTCEILQKNSQKTLEPNIWYEISHKNMEKNFTGNPDQFCRKNIENSDKFCRKNMEKTEKICRKKIENNEKNMENNDKIYSKKMENNDIFEESLLIFPEKLYKFKRKT